MSTKTLANIFCPKCARTELHDHNICRECGTLNVFGKPTEKKFRYGGQSEVEQKKRIAERVARMTGRGMG